VLLILLPALLGYVPSAGAGERGDAMVTRGQIRESVIAGSWYPGDPQRLTQDIKGYLQRVPPQQLEGEPIAVIAPHAGYIYSGQVAAYAYKLVEGTRYDLVAVVAPSHRAYFKGASVYARGGYRTPLGVVPIAEGVADELMKHSALITFVPQAHAQEHSLEIQLPFLQVVLGDFKLLPIVVGEKDLYTCEEISKALVKVLRGKKVLLVASTDLSHFHPYGKAVELDQVVLGCVEEFDPEGLSKALHQGRCEACGGGPTVAVMLAAQALGADSARVLKYANSGDVTGDQSSVVGYMAAVLYRASGVKNERQEPKLTSVGERLSGEDQKTLHEIARSVIWSRASGKVVPEFMATSERLKERRGVFVSLHKHGELRGCIGYIRGIKPLVEAVAEMAGAAAFKDPRFPPVTAGELKDLDIEISVLSPLKQIEDVSEIEVGTHGIYMEKGFYSGLLLPQVAVQYGWDRETFLEQTCMKAGLPKRAWKDKDTKIYIFSADIF